MVDASSSLGNKDILGGPISVCRSRQIVRLADPSVDSIPS